MTSRLRPITRRRRFSVGDEDRQTFLVNAIFAGAIVLALAILAGVAAISYYDANLRPVAHVGDVELRPDIVRQRAQLMATRLNREIRWANDARVRGELDSATHSQRVNDLQTRLSELEFTAQEDLIDIIFQSQLAAEMGISVSDADVDERLAQDTSRQERRHVQVISIEAETSEGASSPTFSQQEAARQRAEEARDELVSGRPFEEVAAEYSNDEDLPGGGDLGFITRMNALDTALVERLFELPASETTEVIRGADGPYRIGRVVEIDTPAQDVDYFEEVQERMSLERYRQFLAWEVASERLRDRVMAEALEGEQEQAKLSHIRIDNVSPDDDIEGEDEDQVHYSEILYAPGDDPLSAPELNEDDPLWEGAREEAEAALAELLAIEDKTARLERFREIAREDSDNDGTAAEGGDAGSVTRDIPPSEVGDVLFDEEPAEDALIEEPVRAENGYYLLWFHERQDPPAQRLEQLVEALEQPDPDWDELVAEYSDDIQSRDEGGVIGWWTRAMLNQIQEDLGDEVFDLEVGGIAEPAGLGSSTHVFRVVERAQREIDADMARFIRGQPGSSHYDTWYSERKDQAEEDGVIRRASDDEEPAEPGLDIGEDQFIEEPIDEEPIDEEFVEESP